MRLLFGVVGAMFFFVGTFAYLAGFFLRTMPTAGGFARAVAKINAYILQVGLMSTDHLPWIAIGTGLMVFTALVSFSARLRVIVTNRPRP